MYRVVTLAALGVLALGAVLWVTGLLDAASLWLAEMQRVAQERLAGAIRSLRGGEPGALAAFWALCLGYGLLHAAGPGHGKLVIGGYGVARQVPLGRLTLLALASSLAQAAVAVGLVYALVAVLGLARGAVEGAADRWVTPAGHVMIVGLGLWLVWRGAGGLRRVAGRWQRTEAAVQDKGHQHGAGSDPHHHHHHHHEHHDHGADCGCGHAHGPSLEEVDRVQGFRDGLVLVLGIALRPCTGALFVLILTWQLGIAMAGVVGAFVMGLGVALVTMATAVLAVWARDGAMGSLSRGRMAVALPLVEITVGGVLAVAALSLLLRAL
ncbi:MAG: hypothetical protein MUE52_20395 [Tabrizicola sp.]|jgi:ABC-type nickel/cobalt efflux system permease component RcnA|nr:hypothetical protein [Tabrizicola sp.]